MATWVTSLVGLVSVSRRWKKKNGSSFLDGNGEDGDMFCFVFIGLRLYIFYLMLEMTLG